jgi:predicted GIY-YIG superfamily endonuclease
LADSPRFTLGDKDLDTLPACPGVYRFLDAGDRALYIGKSVNLRNRVQTHLANARSIARQYRLVADTVRIDIRPTAGEVGALLRENAQIKRQMPLYNRRQRSLRRMWSITLQTTAGGFTTPSLRAYALDQPDILATYGAYGSRWHARKALESLCRRERLCPRVLGLEAGRGPCFQYQIGRCHGACAGMESPRSHNGRLLAALEVHRLSAWPITRPVLLHEVADDPSIQPAEEWHLLHNWTYLGTYDSRDAAARADAAPDFMFDRDTYHILRRTLRRRQLPLLCARSLQPVTWPGTGDLP